MSELQDRLLAALKKAHKEDIALVICSDSKDGDYACSLRAEDPEEALGLVHAAVIYTAQCLGTDPREICQAMLKIIKSQLPASSQELN